MADRLVQLIDKDDDKIYPKFIFDDYILYDETTEDSQLVADMTGATASANGKHGLAPQPNAGDQNKTLTGGGTWEYPLGTVLAYKEWTSTIYVPNNTGTLTAISDTPSSNWGPCTSTGAETSITVPTGESWGVLVECSCEAQIKATGDIWLGPGIQYKHDGGSWVNWASAIWTNRGNDSGDQYMPLYCQRYGLLTSGTWNFRACSVSNSTSCIFIGNNGYDWSRGPAYTFTIRLVDRIKS